VPTSLDARSLTVGSGHTVAGVAMGAPLQFADESQPARRLRLVPIEGIPVA